MKLSESLNQDKRKEIVDYLLSLFVVNGKTALESFSQGQRQVFEFIIFKEKPRGAFLAPTGYGKTEAVSCAVLVRTAINGDNFIIGSVKYGTSDIIMKSVISHIFDNAIFISRLELEGGNDFEKLKRERKKTAINFKNGGSIQIVSFFGSDDNASLGIGKHTPNFILDESPLLSPAKYLQAIKILEGYKYNESFLFELGNALNRNHFMFNVKTNENYQKFFIGLEQAIDEGRLDSRSVEEKRGLPFFKEFYLCQFPDEDEIDDRGYRVLVLGSSISNRFKELPEKLVNPLLGVDVGGGGDLSVFVIRSENKAWVESINKSADTMTNVSEIERIMEKYKIPAENVFVDDIGIGRGVTDRLKEKDLRVNAVSVGVNATDKSRYGNLKAENYWEMRNWIEAGGILDDNTNWEQLTWIKYKVNTDKVIMIEPKEDLKQRTGKSPDYAEALMLTFTKTARPNVRFI